MNAKFLRNGIVMLVLVAGTVALLYTWVQSSAPAAQVPYSEFFEAVEAGNVTKVVQEGESLTVTTKDNKTYTVVVPNSITGDVYQDIRAAATRGGVEPPSFTQEPDGGHGAGSGSC